MRTNLLARLVAEMIDILVYFAVFIGSFIFILPYFLQFFGSMNILIIGLFFILSILVTFALQYPFLKTHQTIGKCFFRLKVVTTNSSRPLNIPIIIQRDIFGKVFTCYFICIPILFGKMGGHELATETKIVRK